MLLAMLNIGEPVYRTCLLTWSEDQNIALTSTRVVYVCVSFSRQLNHGVPLCRCIRICVRVCVCL